MSSLTQPENARRGDPEQGKGAALDIVHTLASLDSSDAGPSYSVPRLCRALSENGLTVSLLSVTGRPAAHGAAGEAYEDRRYPQYRGSLPVIGKLGASPLLRRSVLRAARGADVLHTHGLWRLANIYPALAARRERKPLVLSPRGMLAPSALEFSSVSKRIFWTLRQRRAVDAVAALHATSEQEYQDIRSYGITQPVAVIPNGIDMPMLLSGNQNGREAPTVLFLGRLHPVKAVDRLIKAWKLLGEASRTWRLVIAGPAEQGYDAQLAALIAQLALSNVTMRGAVRGPEKWKLLQGADLFVLPSLSENFAIVVAESLAAGTPVIASRGTPWEGLRRHECGWWVDNSPEELAGALGAAIALSPRERQAMGMRGRDWMERDFGWAGIAEQMTDVYRWLSTGGEPPGCVRVD